MIEGYEVIFIGPEKIRKAFEKNLSEMHEMHEMQWKFFPRPITTISEFVDKLQRLFESYSGDMSRIPKMIIMYSPLIETEEELFTSLVAELGEYAFIGILLAPSDTDKKDSMDEAIKKQKHAYSGDLEVNVNTPYYFLNYENVTNDILDAIKSFSEDANIKWITRVGVQQMVKNVDTTADEPYNYSTPRKFCASFEDGKVTPCKYENKTLPAFRDKYDSEICDLEGIHIIANNIEDAQRELDKMKKRNLFGELVVCDNNNLKYGKLGRIFQKGSRISSKSDEIKNNYIDSVIAKNNITNDMTNDLKDTIKKQRSKYNCTDRHMLENLWVNWCKKYKLSVHSCTMNSPFGYDSADTKTVFDRVFKEIINEEIEIAKSLPRKVETPKVNKPKKAKKEIPVCPRCGSEDIAKYRKKYGKPKQQPKSNKKYIVIDSMEIVNGTYHCNSCRKDFGEDTTYLEEKIAKVFFSYGHGHYGAGYTLITKTDDGATLEIENNDRHRIKQETSGKLNISVEQWNNTVKAILKCHVMLWDRDYPSRTEISTDSDWTLKIYGHKSLEDTLVWHGCNAYPPHFDEFRAVLDELQELVVDSKNTCPMCGSENTAKYRYDYGYEDYNSEDIYKIANNKIIMTEYHKIEHNPTHRCLDCKKDYGHDL